MALVIGGMECPLCGRAIGQEQEIVAFPPFVQNEADPLWLYSDGVFHAEHFHRHPLADAARSRMREVLGHVLPESCRCQVCEAIIADPDDYLSLGHLTADATDPLHRYNYTRLHRSHLPDWADLDRVTALLIDARRSGSVKGRAITWLLAHLAKARDLKHVVRGQA